MLLIGNGQVITRDPEFPYLKDGAVVIDGEVIKDVGTFADMKAAYPDAEFVDAKGGIISTVRSSFRSGGRQCEDRRGQGAEVLCDTGCRHTYQS